MSTSPVRLRDLIGQPRAVTALRNAMRRNRVVHAYLFAGPEGVGKSTAARLFAQALTCLRLGENLHFDACGECPSCELAARNNHVDTWLVTVGPDAEGKEHTQISIDQIRRSRDPRKARLFPRPLLPEAYLKPAISPRKVYLIDPADRMTEEAQNALLKLLEEPPGDTVLVLVSSQPAALLPTIISRCQQLAFQLVGTRAIEHHLITQGLAPATAASLAALSAGRIAWAIRAAQRPEVLAARKALLDLCAGLEARGLPATLRVAEEIKLQALALSLAHTEPEPDEETDEPSTAPGAASDRALRAELPWCLDVMVSWYRDRLAAAQSTPLLNPDYEQMLTKSPPASSSTTRACSQAERAIEAISEAKHNLQRNANIDLALESLAIGLLTACPP